MRFASIVRRLCLGGALLGCAPEFPRFPDFAGATRIVVTSRAGQDTLAVITDPATAAAAAAFADARNGRWRQPWAPAVVPRVRAEFWREGEFLGSFAAGPDFFETERAGAFAARSATPRDVAAFARTLGVARRVGL